MTILRVVSAALIMTAAVGCADRSRSARPVDAAAHRGTYELYDVDRDHGILVHRLDPAERIDVQYMGHRPIAATMSRTAEPTERGLNAPATIARVPLDPDGNYAWRAVEATAGEAR